MNPASARAPHGGRRARARDKRGADGDQASRDQEQPPQPAHVTRAHDRASSPACEHPDAPTAGGRPQTAQHLTIESPQPDTVGGMRVRTLLSLPSQRDEHPARGATSLASRGKRASRRRMLSSSGPPPSGRSQWRRFDRHDSPNAGPTRRCAGSRVCVGRTRLGGPGQPAHRQLPPRAELGDSARPAEPSPTLPSTAVRERHAAGRNDQSEGSGVPSSPAGGDRFTPIAVTRRDDRFAPNGVTCVRRRQ